MGLFSARPTFDAQHTNEWFPVFGEMAGRRRHPTKPGWSVWSNPDPYPGVEKPSNWIKISGPGIEDFEIDLSRLPRDGQFQDVYHAGMLVPIKFGWYKGGSDRGYRSDGTYGKYTVAPGYYGLWT